jgi:FkbM family methyltransferase
MASLIDDAMQRARRAFYNLGGPWYRCRIFEAFGSERFSRPAMFAMDTRLAELMPHKGGTFVEAGAHDGYTQSNTYYLERHRGWSGLLIEPIPELRERCARRRPNSRVLHAALVGPRAGVDSVTMHFGDLMSTMDEDDRHAEGGLKVTGRKSYSVQVPALTLSAALEEANLTNIDVIVLDVEGHELDVLAGLDLELHTPRYLLIEMLDRMEQQPGIDAALAHRYEPVEALSEYDVLYRLKG